MFKPTTSLHRISKLTKPIRVVQGSQAASKTISILMLMINSCQHRKGAGMTVFQYEKSKMKKTVVRDFIKIMKSLGFYNDVEWNKTELIYTFSTGSYIEFSGLDTEDIGKGFRRDVVYFNEANKGRITLDTFIQVQSRSAITYVDFNPDELFWIHTDILKQDNAEIIVVTFKDNEYIPKGELQAILDYKTKGFHDPDGDIDDVNNIKNDYWANKWIVYGLGLPGKLDGSILNNWEICDSIDPDAKLLGSGMDLGFSTDPTVLIRVYKIDDCIIADEVLYVKGYTTPELASEIKQETNIGIIYCDSAEPRTIRELKSFDISIFPVKKGAGSVLSGIEILRAIPTIYVTRTSTNLIRAMQNYSWKKDADGKPTQKPNHTFSDAIDALRYLAISKLKKRSGQYAVI